MYNFSKPTRKSSNRTGALTKRAAGGVIAVQGCLTNGLLRANRNFSRLRRRAAVTPHNAFSVREGAFAPNRVAPRILIFRPEQLLFLLGLFFFLEFLEKNEKLGMRNEKLRLVPRY